MSDTQKLIPSTSVVQTDQGPPTPAVLSSIKVSGRRRRSRRPKTAKKNHSHINNNDQKNDDGDMNAPKETTVDTTVTVEPEEGEEEGEKEEKKPEEEEEEEEDVKDKSEDDPEKAEKVKLIDRQIMLLDEFSNALQTLMNHLATGRDPISIIGDVPTPIQKMLKTGRFVETTEVVKFKIRMNYGIHNEELNHFISGKSLIKVSAYDLMWLVQGLTMDPIPEGIQEEMNKCLNTELTTVKVMCMIRLALVYKPPFIVEAIESIPDTSRIDVNSDEEGVPSRYTHVSQICRWLHHAIKKFPKEKLFTKSFYLELWKLHWIGIPIFNFCDSVDFVSSLPDMVAQLFPRDWKFTQQEIDFMESTLQILGRQKLNLLETFNNAQKQGGMFKTTLFEQFFTVVELKRQSASFIFSDLRKSTSYSYICLIKNLRPQFFEEIQKYDGTFNEAIENYEDNLQQNKDEIIVEKLEMLKNTLIKTAASGEDNETKKSDEGEEDHVVIDINTGQPNDTSHLDSNEEVVVHEDILSVKKNN